MLEKGGYVSVYGDLSGVVFVITGSLTVLFPEEGFLAFSGLRSWWYFGLQFTSCFFFHPVCTKTVQSRFKLGLLFSPGVR